jgi:DNA-binding transcriptional ArsR family regulator
MPRRNGIGIDLLADPTRRRIIGLLAVRPRRPSSLAAEIGRSRPAVTRQLHLLKGAGLVIADRTIVDGRVLLYRINPALQGAITAWLVGTDVGAPYRMQLTDDGREVIG